MDIKAYSPHSASSVTEIRFYWISVPGDVNSAAELPDALGSYVFEDVLAQFDDVLTYNEDQSYFYYHWLAEDDMVGLNYLVNYEWNSIGVFRDGVLLSLLYWDETVPGTDRKFKSITLEYSSTSTIVSSSNSVDNLSQYALHVTAEATYIGLITTAELHPVFNGRIYKERDSGYTTASFTQNSDWTTEQLAGTTSTSQGYFETENTGALNYHFIPTGVTSEKAILFTSPWIGAGFYDPEDGMVYGGRNFQGPLPPDGWEDMGAMRVYNYSIQIFLFHFPKLGTAWVSCQNADTSWQTPWRVGSTGNNSDSVKIMVPSYFSIVPLLFMHINGNFQLVHALNLTEDSDYMDIDYYATQTDPTATADGWFLTTSWNDHTEENDTRSRVVHTLDYLLSSGGVDGLVYLQAYMWDLLLGYGDKKETIAQYWLNQYFISYTTFIQGVRHFSDYEFLEILDCGVALHKEGERTIFIPSNTIDFGGSGVPLITIPEDSVIDNMLYYSDGEIRSLAGEDSLDVSNYSSVQMRNGILVGYNGSSWEEIHE